MSTMTMADLKKKLLDSEHKINNNHDEVSKRLKWIPDQAWGASWRNQKSSRYDKSNRNKNGKLTCPHRSKHQKCFNNAETSV